ncbi:MAG: ImmA/IrrE family metallo-endopeptidase [Agarilytica sp.]
MDRIRATQIASKAIKARKKYLGTGAHVPICPYTLCEAMGMDLRFVKIPSFEGMYIADQNLILISAERPEGRKRFTCAHEIGHHELGHGTIIDEILECGSNKIEEQEADLFASMLLMPSSAVTRAVTKYGVSVERLTSDDAYILSKYFGVSYQAFITHISGNLRLITYKHAQTLKSAKLPDIRKYISGGITTTHQIFRVGKWWEEKALDLEVGDFIVSQNELLTDGPKIFRPIESRGNLFIYEASKPGITRLYNQDWSSFAKVSRHKFQGFFQYKYDEDDE